MGIFSILSRNSRRAARTRRPDDRVAFPGGFRGAIAHDAARCTACQTCAYVCSPSAITFGTAQPDHVEWRYFAGQCTFCGRCVDYCPTRCLAFEGAMPPVTGDPTLHRTTHQVVYQPCPRCGQPVIPLPLHTLQELYGGAVSEEIAAHRGLCERCRRKAAARRLMNLSGGNNRV